MVGPFPWWAIAIGAYPVWGCALGIAVGTTFRRMCP